MAGFGLAAVGHIVGGPAGDAMKYGGLAIEAIPHHRKWEENGCYSMQKGPNALGQRWYYCNTCNHQVCVTCADAFHAGHSVIRKASLFPKPGTCKTWVVNH